ncbi:hypothetical protein BJY00DRAFT_324227 [Aspergillus carlsbadensis]|nr:hypothetical protein BJY00DRAFT_324227 [Aspergillus carlsbadensis]
MEIQLSQESTSSPVEHIANNAFVPSYQCSHCQRRFSRVDHLSRHVRVRMFFLHSDLLKRHGCRHPVRRKLDRANALTSNARRVSQACKPCAVSKVKCDDSKPCGRCTKKNLACEYEWQGGIESDSLPCIASADLHSSSGMEGVLEGDQFQQLSPVETNPDQANDRPLAPGNLTGIVLSNEDRMARTEIAPTLTSTTLSSDRDNDVSKTNDAPFDFDLPSLQTYGFETGFTEATLTYADFLKDLLDWEDPDGVGHQPGRGEGQGNTNIWDQHLNIEQTFDHLPDLSMPDFLLPVVQAEPAAHPAGTDGCTTRNRVTDRTSFEERAFVAGAEAFKGSWWNWSPDSMEPPCSDLDEERLSLPHDFTRDSLRRDPSLSHQGLTVTDRDRVLSVCLFLSDRRALIRIATAFPGIREMESMLHCFLRHQLVDTFSWLHVPTLKVADIADELLAALVAFGASLSHVEGIQKLGHAMADILRSHVIEQWRRDNSSTRHLELLQALYVVTFLGTYSGDRCKMEIAESTSQPVITVLRRARWLVHQHYELIQPSFEDNDAVNQRKWETWVQQETKKRLVYQMFVLDANSSMMNMINPIMRFDEMQLPMPDPNHLWFAPTASEWRSRILSRPRLRGQPSLCENVLRLLTDREMIAGDDPLTLSFFILHGLWAMTWEHRRLQDLVALTREEHQTTETEPPSLGGGAKIVKTLSRMSACIAELPETSMGAKRSEVAFILEFLNLTLHVPLDCLQAFAGKNGAQEAQLVCHLLQEWCPTKQARQAMWHGGQLIRAAKELPPEKMRDIKVVLIYQTSLAFWAYGTIHIARRKRDGCATPALSNTSQLVRKPLVPLDGPLTSAVRRFISIDEGTPCISEVEWQDGGRADECKVHLLLKPSQTVGVAISVLRPYRQYPERSYQPIVESFTRLMSEIGKAAQTIGI